MDYVLILIDYLPPYIKYIINSILSVDKDANIFIGSNQYVNFKNTHHINLNDITSDEVEKFKDLNIYKGTVFEQNPLWMNSVLRIFYLKEISAMLNSEMLVHFDNDVIIYKPFSLLNQALINKKVLNITPGSPKKLVFGYSVIPKGNNLMKICKEINEIAKLGIQNKWEFNSNKPFNEMNFLGSIYNRDKNLINLLPTLPYQSKLIFDPSNYGQFFDGTHMHPHNFLKSNRKLNLNENIDVEIYTKRIRPKFKRKSPYVLCQDNKYELVNLHIHSKRFDKFLPPNYKNYL